MSVLDDVVNAAGDFFTSAVDRIPGGRWIRENINDAVKHLAETTEGRTALWIISQALVSGAYTSLAPIVGPQAAAVAFAVPGVLRGEPFSQAWLSEFTLRLGSLAKMYGNEAAKNYASDQQAAFDNTALKNLSPQGLDTLIRTSGLADPQAALAWANLRPEELALRYGGRVDAWAGMINERTGRKVFNLADYTLASGKTENPFAPPIPKGDGLPTGQGWGLGTFAETATDQGLAFAAHAFDAPSGPSPVAPKGSHIALILGALGLAGYGAYRYLRRR